MSNGLENGVTAATGCLIYLLVVVLNALLLAYPVMLLWNWVIPGLFALPVITFKQALGLSLLCGLLFKSTTNVNRSK